MAVETTGNTNSFDMYRMTDERQKELWADCLFVFDASALLALYLYPEDARQRIYTEIFEKIKDRLWIPQHVWFEFLKNRSFKIREPILRSYKPLNDEYIKPLVDAFGKSLNRVDALKNTLKYNDSHPFMVSEELEKYGNKLKKFMADTLAFSKSFQEQTEQKINEILLLEQNDTVAETLQRYFKIGREYSYDEILKISVEGKHRYEFKIPPGYEDLKDKIGTQIFGDLILWKQLLEHARAVRRNVVFVCNDLKEDWWQLVSDHKGKPRPDGPRKELIKEFKDATGGVFWMYSQARFLDLSNALIPSNVPNRYIEQVSRFSEYDTEHKWLIYACSQCGREDVIDLASLSLRFKSSAAGESGSHTYSAAHDYNCKHCHHPIRLTFEVTGKSDGEINHRTIVFSGARQIETSHIDEHLAEAEALEDQSPPEEIIVLDKKKIRLQAGKKRRIRFADPLASSDTLFQIDYLPLKGTSGPKRLLINAFDAKKDTLSKVLVLESGTIRFRMSNDEAASEKEIISLQLLPDEDMSILLSVASYPGNGRYAEKLYY